MKNKKIPLFIMMFCSILFFELIFRIFTVEHFFSISLFYILFYSMFISFLLSFFCSLISHRKSNVLISKILLFLLAIWYSAEIIFKRSFHVYFSFSTTFFADQAVSFLDKAFEIILMNWFPILLLFIPFIVSLLISKKIVIFPKKQYLLIACIISYGLFFGILFLDSNVSHSAYSLYFDSNNNALNKETFGAIPSVFIEIRKMLFVPEVEFIQVVKEEEKEIVYDKNILDIDFESLYNNESDSTLKSMHGYFMIDEGTSQNEYTGYFKDKNLILVMAESFNSIAVSETLTPTLYKLSHEGFVFENFYSPVILSTIGGEFQELTGLYPDLSMLSRVWRKGTNSFPFGFGSVFNNEGYFTSAYHNHRYNFQDRDKYLSSLGLSNYSGCKNGLEKRINCSIWPESDLELMSATVSDFSSKDKFFTYYVTVSGHMSYNFTANKMAIKHQSEVDSLEYSTDIKAYIAANIELDLALESLINSLQEEGVLDDTVIALVGDHYPYDISLEHINEVAEPDRDSTIEINRSNFILWNSDMESVEINKVGGNMDVLPTLLNLFDIEYDSRLIMGKDLLSSSDGLVIFADQSWISDKGKYLASTKTFLPNSEDVDYNGYVEEMNQIVSNRVNLSKLIIEKDYYKKVVGE